jgi:ATP-dependent Clp protease protease subunit
MSGYTIPNVIARDSRGERIMDVYSHLLDQRIVYLGTGIDAGVANALIVQLLHLEAADQGQDIQLYINCEGGDPSAMLAVYDTMRYIRSPVATTCVGQAVAVGAVLLAAGAQGKRSALPHTRVVLHQPAAQGRGSIPDLILQADEVVRIRADLEAVLSRHTGQPVARLRADTDHDRIFTAVGARDYGLIAASSSGAEPGAGLRGEREGAAAAGATHRDRRRRGRGPQLLRDGEGEIEEGHLECPRDRSDHLARRLLRPALHLGQVLRGDPRASSGLPEGLASVVTQGPQPVAEHVPPERLDRPRGGRRTGGSRGSGHARDARARRGPRPRPLRSQQKRPTAPTGSHCRGRVSPRLTRPRRRGPP